MCKAVQGNSMDQKAVQGINKQYISEKHSALAATTLYMYQAVQGNTRD
jgi:hypothetical protein